MRVFSLNRDERYEFDLRQPDAGKRGIWLDYVEGVAQGLLTGGYNLSGADLALVSDVPEGAGLSSSAALEVSVGFALLTLAGVVMNEATRKQLALAGQFAEHNYVGTQSGIMDQFISALGRKDHALLIDCRTQNTTLVPLDLHDTEHEARIVVCDSHVKHELSSSEYNVRRKECEQGVELLREFMPEIKALRDVTPESFQKYEMKLPEPVRRRCRHVIGEDARTLAATHALSEKRLEEFGRLMYVSHASLRDDYEVSCAELDTLVAIASKVRGVYGARMTGGGFGGCTVNLVRRDALDEFKTIITSEYAKATRLQPTIYVVEACDGAKEI
ncbi:MAG: galactokinase [Pyrinomonadaceae bacterium]